MKYDQAYRARTLDTCYSIHGLLGQAQQNKPDTKDYALQESTHEMSAKSSATQRQKVGWGARVWGGVEGNVSREQNFTWRFWRWVVRELHPAKLCT